MQGAVITISGSNYCFSTEFNPADDGTHLPLRVLCKL